MQKEDQGKLMFSNNEQSSRRNDGGFLGRSLVQNGNRSRVRFNNHTEDKNQNSNKVRSKVICWKCDNSPHFSSICPERQIGSQEKKLNKTQVGDEIYVHEVVFLNGEKVIPKNLDINKRNTSVWYLDNGASNHLTGNKDFFSSLNQNTRGKVKFGDGSFVYNLGKGLVTFACKAVDKKALRDIY